MGIVQGAITDLGDDVAGLQAGLGGGTIGIHGRDIGAPFHGEAIGVGYPGVIDWVLRTTW